MMSLFAGAAACGEPVAAPPDATFRVEPIAQWSGGWVRVHSVALAEAGSIVITAVGDTTPLETRREADTTVALRVPIAPSGSLQPLLRLDGWSYFLDAISVYGYTGVRQIPVVMDGDLLVWPRNGHANVFGGTPDGVALLQANTGQVRLFPGTGEYGYLAIRSPGVTYRDGVFALGSRVGSPAELWRLLPSTERLGTDSGISVGRQVMQLNPRTWVVTGPHYYWLLTWSDSLGRYDGLPFLAEEPEGANMSPRGDRATLRVDWVSGGAPVFDAPAGTIAYRVAGMLRVDGADFSADGEWLALVGGSDFRGSIGDTNRLMLLRAATGEIVRDTILDRVAFAVTLDAYAPLMYVGVDGPNGPMVLVFERDSWRLLAELQVPASAPPCFIFDGCYKAVIARSAEPALYVVWGFQGRTLVWRFAMLPGALDAGPEVARGGGRP